MQNVGIPEKRSNWRWWWLWWWWW